MTYAGSKKTTKKLSSLDKQATERPASET